jgi:hypothetical protein
MRGFSVLICLSLLALVGCHSKVTGTLKVDDNDFAATLCRSGRAFGFYGIELTDSGGRRLRLFENPDGTCSAALFNGDSATGDGLGQCGVLTMTAQSSSVSGIRNLQGTAKLSCETGAHKVAGNFEFENCH